MKYIYIYKCICIYIYVYIYIYIYTGDIHKYTTPIEQPFTLLLRTRLTLMASDRVQKCIGFWFGYQCMYQSKRSAMQPLDSQCARAFLGKTLWSTGTYLLVFEPGSGIQKLFKNSSLSWKYGRRISYAFWWAAEYLALKKNKMSKSAQKTCCTKASPTRLLNILKTQGPWASTNLLHLLLLHGVPCHSPHAKSLLVEVAYRYRCRIRLLAPGNDWTAISFRTLTCTKRHMGLSKNEVPYGTPI